MSSAKCLVELIEVEKSFQREGGTGSVSVLSGVTGAISEGESVAIVGPSGSGKSTLLNLIGSLDQPTTGKVIIAGEDVGAMDESKLADFRNQQIGFVFQSHHLLPQCTVLENVLVPTLASRDPRVKEAAMRRAPVLLKKVGLEHRLEHRPAQLSGGECQRVAVVRALINEPKLLLADEPTGALDRQSADALSEMLLQLNREEGVTLIVVTHSGDLAKRMRRTLSLQDGKLVDDSNA